jgi:hypothetical protein
VPAEAIRLQRRLGARDRWFIALVTFALLAGAVSALVVSREGGRSTAEGDARCVAVVRASWMGGATFRHCGADAVTFCRRPGQDAESLAECRRLGLPARAINLKPALGRSPPL